MIAVNSRRLLIMSVIALLLSVCATFKAALAQEGPSTAPEATLREATITVTATSSVLAEPDIAVIRAGAVTEAPTARAALDANSKIMEQAFETLQRLGVDNRDMQTSQLSVNPRYTYFEPQNGTRRPPRIDGYTVSNNLTLRLRDLATIGEALDALIDAGVNEMGGLSFAVDEPDELMQNARREAVQKALAEAELLTDAAGVALGRVISISQNTPQPRGMQPRMAAMAADAIAESVPIATGEQSIRAIVTIVWAIDNGGTR